MLFCLLMITEAMIVNILFRIANFVNQKKKIKNIFSLKYIISRIAFVQMYRSLTMYWLSLHYIRSLSQLFYYTI